MFDLRRRLSVIRDCGISLSHKARLKLGSVPHRMTMNCFLKVWIALSAAFLR